MEFDLDRRSGAAERYQNQAQFQLTQDSLDTQETPFAAPTRGLGYRHVHRIGNALPLGGLDEEIQALEFLHFHSKMFLTKGER